jgi:hypothetical protein
VPWKSFVEISNILYTIRRYYELIDGSIKRAKGEYGEKGWNDGKKWVFPYYDLGRCARHVFRE